MIKNTIINLKKAEDQRCQVIANTAIEKDIPYTEAEKLHSNDLRAYAIGKLAESMKTTYAEAEKYHDELVRMTKGLMQEDKESKEDLLMVAEEQDTYDV